MATASSGAFIKWAFYKPYEISFRLCFLCLLGAILYCIVALLLSLWPIGKKLNRGLLRKWFLAAVGLSLFMVIAMPPYLEPSFRSAVSRAKNDMRSVGIALESYEVENHRYPPRLDFLTSPVAYAKSIPRDGYAKSKSPIKYYTASGGWILWSAGPDKRYDITDRIAGRIYESNPDNPIPALLPMTYDATNGSESAGDIWRVKE